jgi:hypothetical protein
LGVLFLLSPFSFVLNPNLGRERVENPINVGIAARDEGRSGIGRMSETTLGPVVASFLISNAEEVFPK